MAQISNIQLPSGTGYGIRAGAIPFGEVDSTSTSTDFTATVPGITELVDGTIIILKNGIVTSASGFTLNINGLGAKPCYTNMATGYGSTDPTRETTIFNINYTMLFIYSEDIVTDGGWICYRGFDSNTNTIAYQMRRNNGTYLAKEAVYRYQVLFSYSPTEVLAPSKTSNSTGTSKTMTSLDFDPFGAIWIYYSTTTVAAGAAIAIGSMWSQYTFDLRYSFNCGSITTNKDVYVKCSPQSNGRVKLATSGTIVQALPTTEDGYVYIYLGHMYSTSSCVLALEHPVYYYKDGAIRLWSNATEADIPTKTSELENDSGFITSGDIPASINSVSADIGDYTADDSTMINIIGASGIATGVQTVGNVYIGHTNSITEGTAGTSSNTSGSTLAVPYVTYDAQGHVTAAGTHTHTITGFSTTDQKLQINAVTSDTQYYPIVGTGTTATTRQYDMDGFKYKGTTGTTSVVGSSILELGNDTGSGTATNKQGQLVLYGSNTKKATISLAAPSADIALSLPTSAGTLALTSQIPTVPTATGNSTTGISIANHGTGTVIGVQSTTTTASKVTLGDPISVPNVTSAGSASTWVFEEKSIPNVTSAGSASTWTFEEKTIPNVTSAGSASTWTFEEKTIPNVTSAGSGSASLTMTMDTTDTKKLNIAFSHTHTAPTLGTAIKVQSKSGGSNGTAPTLGTAIKVQSKSGGSNGTAPTLGTAINVQSKKSGANGTAPTLGTAISIANITNVDDVTVPIKNTSASTFVTGTTHTITDNGHTHSI